MNLISIDPATGNEIKAYPKYAPNEVAYILDQASQAQKNWCNSDLDLRISCLEQIAGTLRDRADNSWPRNRRGPDFANSGRLRQRSRR